MSDSSVVRWSKSRVTEAKRGSLTFMLTSIVSEWFGGGVLVENPKCKSLVVTQVAVVYQDFALEGEERKAMIWAETCTRGNKFILLDEDPETSLTEEFWESEVSSYVDYFIGELSKHKLETLEPRVDPVEEVIQSIKILMNRKTKVDPKLH